MRLFTSKNTSSYTLSISLKSSSIDLELVRISRNGPREVVLVQRKIILLGNSQDPQLYTSQCISELTSLLKGSAAEISSMTQGKTYRTVIVLYAPWFTSNISVISHKDSVVVSEKFLADQMRSIKTPKQLVNLEKKVVRILTNGYSITELTESRFSNISLDVYSSYMSRQTYDILNQTVTACLPLSEKAAYMTSPILLFGQIKKLLVHEDNISFVCVGGEITEVGIIEDDSLSYYATFPVGKHDFLREIQGNIQSYDYDLLYQKEIKLKGKGQQERVDRLKSRWVEFVLAAYAGYSKSVPSKLLIVTDSKSRDFFADLLIRHLKTGPVVVHGQYRIINFDMSLFKDIITYNTPTLTNELDLHLEALT